MIEIIIESVGSPVPVYVQSASSFKLSSLLKVQQNLNTSLDLITILPAFFHVTPKIEA